MHRTNKSPGAQEGDAGWGGVGGEGWDCVQRDRMPSATLSHLLFCFFQFPSVLCSVLFVLLWQLPLNFCVQLHRSQIYSRKEQLLPFTGQLTQGL